MSRRFICAILAVVLALPLAGCGCSGEPDEPAPATDTAAGTGSAARPHPRRNPAPPKPTSNTGSDAATEQAPEAKPPELTTAEARALELRQHWSALRTRFKDNLTRDGRLKLMLTDEQARRDFARGLDGVLPTSANGAKVYQDTFAQALAAAKNMYTEAIALVRTIRGEPAAVRQAFWATMPVHGLRSATIAPNGTRVFFVQDSRASSYGASVFEQDAIPLDPADKRPGADVYMWDLRHGGVDCLTAAALDAAWLPDSYSVSTTGGPVAVGIGSTGGNAAATRGIALLQSPTIAATHLIGSEAITFANLPQVTLPANERMVFAPSLSGDGNTIAFVAGQYVNRFREEGYTIEAYHLIVWHKLESSFDALTRCPVDRLHWPVISGDGSKVAVVTVPKAFDPPPAKPAALGESPSAGQTPALYLVTVDGTTPPEAIALPKGATLPSVWEHSRRPIALSTDGSRGAIELSVGGRLQVYSFAAGKAEMTLVSTTVAGKPGNGDSSEPSVSADGRTIVFKTRARDLPAQNPSGLDQIVIYDVLTRAMRLLSRDAQGQPFKCHSRSPSISADGLLAAFIADIDVVPGSLSAAFAAAAKPDRCDRLVVVNTRTGTVLSLGGQRVTK